MRSAVAVLPRLLLLVLGGAMACRSTDTAASAGDAGAPAVTTDAGQSDAGVPNGTGLALQVAANPNNVLSAVATVSWPSGTTLISVSYQAANGEPQSTPRRAVAAAASPMIVPVLGLRAETTYTLQAVAEDASGNVTRSTPVTFTTGALPADFHQLAVAAGGQPTPGYTLVARQSAAAPTSTDYVTIIDGTGTPVWYLAVKPGLGGDFQRQPDGTFTVAVTDPAHYITGLTAQPAVYQQFDVLGNPLHTWTAQNVVGTDEHEIRFQPNGDAVLFGFATQQMDMTPYGGSATALVVGNVLQRVTAAGTATFTWSAFDHLSVANMVPQVPQTGDVVDFTHANSIDVMADGSYLISLRHLSQLLKIDSTSGDVLWKLGGADSDFTFVNDPLNGFSMQHGARELPNGNILLFDDGNAHSPPQSRAVEYQLDPTAHTATLVWSAEDSPPLYGLAMGNVQRLANGHTLICYGTASRVQEVDAAGNVVWDVSDPNPGFGFYRAFHVDSLY